MGFSRQFIIYIHVYVVYKGDEVRGTLLGVPDYAQMSLNLATWQSHSLSGDYLTDGKAVEEDRKVGSCI